jgi:hypothetical protein
MSFNGAEDRWRTETRRQAARKSSPAVKEILSSGGGRVKGLNTPHELNRKLGCENQVQELKKKMLRSESRKSQAHSKMGIKPTKENQRFLHKN